MFGMMERRLQERMDEGELVKESNAYLECKHCHTKFSVIPARHWGQDVDGYYMVADHPCQEEPQELSTEVKQNAKYVILAKGQALFITERERNGYLDAMQKGKSKGVNIRNYFVDGLYSIIPFDEWRMTEERRGNNPPEHVVI